MTRTGRQIFILVLTFLMGYLALETKDSVEKYKNYIEDYRGTEYGTGISTESVRHSN